MLARFLALLTLIVGTLAAAPQAVVFDFGGVLTGAPNREMVIHFIRESFDLSQEEFEKINLEKRQAVTLGVQTDEEFWLAYAQGKGIALPEDWGRALKNVMIKALGINPRMYSLVEQLRRQKMPVALLSNVDQRFAKLIREFGFYEPFDLCLLSCEIGVEKPDPKAYKILLAHLDLPAEGVIFIDDRSENVEAAKKVGLDAIFFQSEGQLRRELAQRGISMEV